MKLWKSIGIGIIALIVLGMTLFFAFDGEALIEPKISYVSATEYISGDEGQVILRLLDYRQSPITTATCYDTILFPNKTIFMQDQSMTLNIENNYYHSFTVPIQDGVYETIARCEYNQRNYTNAKTFHVSLFSSKVFSLFSGMNDSYNSMILTQSIQYQNITQEMIDGFTATVIQINQTYDALHNDITLLSDNVQQNFSFVISLINALNFSISENQSHSVILSYLDLINQTTQSTQQNLISFQSETNTKLDSINNTILQINQDTETIIAIVSELNTTTISQYNNITQQITDLTTTVNQNQNITQQNITELKDMILNLSNQMNVNCQDLNHTIYLFWNDTSVKYSALYDLSNLTEWEVNLILQYLNISTTNLRIYVEHNNCILGSTYQINAQVVDYFNHVLTDLEVYCNITTNYWGNSTMSYNWGTGKFEYSHLCSPEGIVEWIINCEWW